MTGPESADAVSPVTRQFAFMPWLRLKKAYSIAAVEFVPMRDASGVIAPILADAVGALSKILSGYITRDGKVIDNCVVATIAGRGWDLLDNDFAKVEWASSLLFLAAWACNDYFPR